MPDKIPTKEKKTPKKVTDTVTNSPKAKKIRARFITSEIRPCTCSHAFQDERHGRGRRVFNPCKKGSSLRCTVCHREAND